MQIYFMQVYGLERGYGLYQPKSSSAITCGGVPAFEVFSLGTPALLPKGFLRRLKERFYPTR